MYCNQQKGVKEIKLETHIAQPIWSMNVKGNYSLYNGRGETIHVSHSPTLSAPCISWILQQTTDFSHHSFSTVPPFLSPFFHLSLLKGTGHTVMPFVSYSNVHSWLLSAFLITLNLSCLCASPLLHFLLLDIQLGLETLTLPDLCCTMTTKDTLKKESSIYFY